MSKSKVLKYLNGKRENEYSNLDTILKQYLNGELYNLLSQYGFSEIEVFPDILKKGNYVEIFLIYQNIAVNVELTEDEVSYGTYTVGCSAEKVLKNEVCIKYEENFLIKDLIENIFKEIKNNPNLKEISKKEINKKNNYRIISDVCLFLPLIIIGIIALYIFISHKSFSVNPFVGTLFVVIPIVLHIYFYLKSKK